MPLKMAVVTIGNTSFRVQVADTRLLRTYGLMGRTKLCSLCGMLFVFDAPGVYPFWMKNTPLPLDIVWIRNWRIAFIASRTEPYSTTKINPNVEADLVLEVGAGKIAAIGVEVGELVNIRWLLTGRQR